MGSGLLAALLVACQVGPDYEAPETPLPGGEALADGWRVSVEAELSDEEPDIARWWEGLGDETLVRLLERAELSNVDLALALARVEEAAAVRGIREGALFPNVAADGQFVRSEVSENSRTGQDITAAGGSIEPDSEWSIGGSLFWEVDVFGRIRRSIEAADADYEATIEDYRDVQVFLFAAVAANYVDMRALERRLLLAQQNAEAQRNSLRLTRDRFDAGLTSALDVAQAEQNLAQTESAIPSLEAALVASENRLSVLLGLPAGTLRDVVPIAESGLPDAPRSLVVGVPADLLRRRPDIRRAERGLAAETARIGVAEADLYPTFTISGAVRSVAESAGDLGDSDSLAWSFVPAFRWDLFAGGAIRSNIEAQEARMRQALAVYQRTVLEALEEVNNALVAYDRELVRRDRLREAVSASQRAVDLVREQYLSGLTNFQNLLDAQRSLFQQQDLLAESEGEVVQILILLNRALGGGWSLDEESS